MKKVKGRIKVLKVMPYKGAMVYIRQVDGDIFEYLVSYKKDLYCSYLVISPREGKKRLSKSDTAKAVATIFAGAVTTIDTLKDSKKKDARNTNARGKKTSNNNTKRKRSTRS